MIKVEDVDERRNFEKNFQFQIVENYKKIEEVER